MIEIDNKVIELVNICENESQEQFKEIEKLFTEDEWKIIDQKLVKDVLKGDFFAKIEQDDIILQEREFYAAVPAGLIDKNATAGDEFMLQGVTSVYNQTLYFLRQSYFEGLKNERPIKLPSGKELYHSVVKTDAWKNAKVDTYAKNAAYKLAMQNFFTYFKAANAYRKNPSKFLGKPKIPNYVKDRYIPVILDKTRLRKKGTIGNQFKLPLSDVIISFSNRLEKNDFRNVSFNQCCGKIKVNISYEKKEEEPIINNSFIGIDIGIDNLASITSNDKNFSYIVKGTPLKSTNQYYNKRRA